MPASRGRNPIRRTLVALVAAAIACLALMPVAAWAQVGSARYSSIVVEMGSGGVLEAANADANRHPASLTKVMTLFLVFEALRDRRITLDQYVPISAHAASMAPTKLGLVPGTRITVEQAILGLVTKSANDAAAALGEMLGGTEERFAQMMTLRARSMGMTRTTFMNASGLPNPDQWSTARDMAVLARRLISTFPEYYRYFSAPSFVWQRRTIYNHDRLLKSYPGADGLKTGYTEASGYNLISSAVRGNVRLVGVVMGTSSNNERDAHMTALLDRGYQQLDVPILRAPNPVLIGSAHAAPAERFAAKTRPSEASWSVFSGPHPSEKDARTAAATAKRAVEAGNIQIETLAAKRGKQWRGVLAGLSQPDARSACAALAKRNMPCVWSRPGPRQVAGR